MEIQPVLDRHLTGVGLYTYNILKEVKNYRDDGDTFYFLGMDYYDNSHRMEPYLDDNIILKTNGIMHYGIYRRIWHLIPFIHYGAFFGVDADIYHFFNYVAPPYVKGKVVITVYDMVYKLFPETMERSNYKKLDRNLKQSCKRADRIITISENSKREIQEYLDVDSSKIDIIYPAVDHGVYTRKDRSGVDKILAKYSIPEDYFLYLGTLEPRKNIETIIESFKIFKDRYNSDHTLVIAGKKGWMYDKIFSMVDRYNLEGDVVFPGYVAEEDKPYLYSGARAFIFPSLYEGFGMPPLESMACGTPVIASNTSSLPEVVGDGGFLVDPHDIEAICDCMYHLAFDDILHRQLSKGGVEYSKTFSWQQSAKELLDIYRNI